MKPAKPITDPSFRYTPSVQTDIRKLFARIRREQAAAAQAEREREQEAVTKVRELKRGTR